MKREEIVENCNKMLEKIAEGIKALPRLDIDKYATYTGKDFEIIFWNTGKFTINTKHTSSEYAMLDVFTEKWSGKNELITKIWKWSETDFIFSNQVSTCMDLANHWEEVKTWIILMTQRQNDSLKAIANFEF